MKTLAKRTNNPFFNTIDTLLNDFDTFPKRNYHSLTHPKVNIIDTENNFQLQFFVPGIDKSDLAIDLEENTLKVSFKAAKKAEEKTVKYTRQEFLQKSFERTFSIPDNVDLEKIVAQHKNGILTIELPKVEATLPKKASIHIE